MADGGMDQGGRVKLVRHNGILIILYTVQYYMYSVEVTIFAKDG